MKFCILLLGLLQKNRRAIQKSKNLFLTSFLSKRKNCDDKFSRTLTGLSGGTGGTNSVETTRPTRTETRHDFRTDVKKETAFCSHSGHLFVERSNIHRAKVKAKIEIIKTVQGACLTTNWCEVLF